MVVCFFQVLVFGLNVFFGFLDGLSPGFDGFGFLWLLKYAVGAVGIVPFIPPCLLRRRIMQNDRTTRHKVMQRILIPFQLTFRQGIDRALPLLSQGLLLGHPLLELDPKGLLSNILHALHARH